MLVTDMLDTITPYESPSEKHCFYQKRHLLNDQESWIPGFAEDAKSKGSAAYLRLLSLSFTASESPR
ncbi:hypothetical protein STEG23_022928 [Scotinomys teguina]